MKQYASPGPMAENPQLVTDMKLKYHVLEEFLRCINESHLKNTFILRGSLLTRQWLKTFRQSADLDFVTRMGGNIHYVCT